MHWLNYAVFVDQIIFSLCLVRLTVGFWSRGRHGEWTALAFFVVVVSVKFPLSNTESGQTGLTCIITTVFSCLTRDLITAFLFWRNDGLDANTESLNAKAGLSRLVFGEFYENCQNLGLLK